MQNSLFNHSLFHGKNKILQVTLLQLFDSMHLPNLTGYI